MEDGELGVRKVDISRDHKPNLNRNPNHTFSCYKHLFTCAILQ